MLGFVHVIVRILIFLIFELVNVYTFLYLQWWFWHINSWFWQFFHYSQNVSEFCCTCVTLAVHCICLYAECFCSRFFILSLVYSCIFVRRVLCTLLICVVVFYALCVWIFLNIFVHFSLIKLVLTVNFEFFDDFCIATDNSLCWYVVQFLNTSFGVFFFFLALTGLLF